jgi:primosomal protein N'
MTSPASRELVRQLEGALVNSEGRDFQISASFVREIIAALASATPSAESVERAAVLVNEAAELLKLVVRAESTVSSPNSPSTRMRDK